MQFRTATGSSPISGIGLLIWLLAALFFLYEFFLRTFIGSISHQIIPDLQLSAEQFAMLGSSYYIVYGAMQIPAGVLVDRFGLHFVLSIACLICALATLYLAQVTHFHGAMIARVLMGFGSSFAFVGLLVIAIHWFPQRYFAFFAGTSQLIGTLGPLLAGGPLILLLARLHNHWRTPLFSIGAIGIVLALLILCFVRDRPEQKTKPVQCPPLKDRLLQLAQNRQAWAIALYSGAVYVSISFLGVIWGTEYLQTRGLSQASSASIIAMSWIGYAIACPLLGAFSDIAKRRKPILIACAVLGIFVTLIILLVPITAHWIYVLLFVGLGFAASGQNVGFATIAEQVAPHTKASALGLNNAMISVFDTVVASVASLFITIPKTGINHATPNNFVWGLSFLPLMLITATIIAIFFIKETYCEQQTY